MRILCLHQSADLYGSDRSFLQVVEYLKSSGKFELITVILPRNGPLVLELQKLDVDVKFEDMSLLSKTYLKKLQWHKIIFPLLSFSKKKAFMNKYDIVYANTSVILDFYAIAPFLNIKKIIHIREIPAPWLSKVLSSFIKKSNSLVIFNSYSTKESFADFENSMVIHNAFEGYEFIKKSAEDFVTNSTPLKILVIGRINPWKGQEFVIRSIAALGNKNISLRIVGSPAAGNENLLVDLKQLTLDLGLTSQIEFVEFTEDPSSEYQNCDLLIVPSIKPEPFGRIAIEAMSIGKPVIAANHGGLPEIVEHKVNGFLFPPNDQNSFITYLKEYLADRQLLEKHGEESRRIFLDKFSVDKLHKQLESVF